MKKFVFICLCLIYILYCDHVLAEDWKLSVYIVRENESSIVSDGMLDTTRSISKTMIEDQLGSFPGFFGQVLKINLGQHKYCKIVIGNFHYELRVSVSAFTIQDIVNLNLDFKTNDARFYPQLSVSGTGILLMPNHGYKPFMLMNLPEKTRCFVFAAISNGGEANGVTSRESLIESGGAVESGEDAADND
jgi:hypothetical protein